MEALESKQEAQPYVEVPCRGCLYSKGKKGNRKKFKKLIIVPDTRMVKPRIEVRAGSMRKSVHISKQKNNTNELHIPDS